MRLMGTARAVDPNTKYAASLESLQDTMAASYRRESTTDATPTKDRNSPRPPRSSGVYSRVNSGETARTIACPKAVPPANITTPRVNRPLGSKRASSSCILVIIGFVPKPCPPVLGAPGQAQSQND